MHLYLINELIYIGDDTAFSNTSSSGQFQVKEAYSTRTLESWDARDSKWDCVWKWPRPDRVKTFLWLCFHERLLTNVHMTQDARCDRCHKSDETISHCLRDCDEAVKVWLRLVPMSDWNSFFSLPSDQWLLRNLRQSKVVSHFQASWNMIFGVCYWLLWN